MPPPSGREIRYKVFEPIEVFSAGGARRAHLLNISVNGALLHMPAGGRAGDHIVLQLPQCRVTARIVWAKLPRFGIRFTQPVSSLALDALLTSTSAA
jgi:hypothetical protein